MNRREGASSGEAQDAEGARRLSKAVAHDEGGDGGDDNRGEETRLIDDDVAEMDPARRAMFGMAVKVELKPGVWWAGVVCDPRFAPHPVMVTAQKCLPRAQDLVFLFGVKYPFVMAPCWSIKPFDGDVDVLPAAMLEGSDAQGWMEGMEQAKRHASLPEEQRMAWIRKGGRRRGGIGGERAHNRMLQFYRNLDQDRSAAPLLRPKAQRPDGTPVTPLVTALARPPPKKQKRAPG